MKSHDVCIVGGGLAGLTLAALLGRDGARVLCLDREKPDDQLKSSFDGRTTAISFGSRQVMIAAGVWPRLGKAPCPIHTIEILDGGSPVLMDFRHEEVGGRPFGWIVENAMLRRALLDTLRALPNVTHAAPVAVTDFIVTEKQAAALTADGKRHAARLVVGADGRQSFTREWMGIGARSWNYKQRAVVCTTVHERPHDNVAIEHFHPAGPFAILPMTDDADGAHRSSVVWTEHAGKGVSALDFDQRSFDAALTARFPARYGAVRQAGGRFAYPLGLVHAHDYIAPRMALVAEAAHVLHPIAGQGLNMGLRDIAALAALVRDALADGGDPGDAALLTAYQQRRRIDNMGMAAATDGLNRLFSTDRLPVKLARRAGLRAVARVPAAKQFFMKQAMGAAGLLPALLRD